MSTIRKIVQITQDIRFIAPWKTLQYARKGDYIVYRNEKDIYAVPKELFKKTYSILS